MQHVFKSIFAILFSFLLLQPVFAAERATAEEATALVKRAAVYMKANGNEKAFAEFSNPKGSFVDRELYIIVFSQEGMVLAHGANTKIIGKNLIDMKDGTGKPIVRAFVDIAKGKGSGWHDYEWPNPVTGQVEHKSSYFEKNGDMMVVSGIFKK